MLRQRQSHLSPRPTWPDAVPLYYVVLCGFCDLLDCLLDAHPQYVNAWGGTLLHVAIDKGHLSIVLLLLECGANVESQDSRSQTALCIASSRGYAEVVRLLIDRGVDLNAECDDKGFLHYIKWTP
jgi:ankyrin repeat protein